MHSPTSFNGFTNSVTIPCNETEPRNDIHWIHSSLLNTSVCTTDDFIQPKANIYIKELVTSASRLKSWSATVGFMWLKRELFICCMLDYWQRVNDYVDFVFGFSFCSRFMLVLVCLIFSVLSTIDTYSNFANETLFWMVSSWKLNWIC